MAKLNRQSISRRTVEALKVDKDTVFWGRDLPGFGVRVYASGTKMYVVQGRADEESVRGTVGRHGVITADEARRCAARILNRFKAGEEPGIVRVNWLEPGSQGFVASGDAKSLPLFQQFA